MQGRGNLYFFEVYFITGYKKENTQIILVHNLFSLKAMSGLLVLKANMKSGNNTRNGMIKQSANQSFQMGENIWLRIFNCIQTQN